MERRVVMTLGAAIVAAVIGLAGSLAGWFAGFDENATDALHPGTEGSDEILVIAIDRASLAANGQIWPWPRSLHAALLDQLTAAGAAVVVYDVLFAATTDDDERLSQAIGASPPLVLAAAGQLGESGDLGLPVATSLVGPVATLRLPNVEVGHANVSVDAATGVVRLVPLAVEDDRGLVVPSIALAALAMFDGGSAQFVVRGDGVQVGSRFVPAPGGELRINYSDDFAQPSHIAADDVLSGRTDPALLRNKIVFVGVTEPTLGDQHLIPVDKSGATSGVSIHAEALNTMLQSSYLEPASGGRDALTIAAAALVAALLVMYLPIMWGLAASVVWGFALVLLVVIWFDRGTIVGVTWPLATALIATVISVALRFLAETRHRRRATKLFAQYVPESDVERLSDPRLLEEATNGRRFHAAVMFCDIRGFTAMSSAMEPSDLRELLTLFYGWATDKVQARGGSVLAFIGDEVYAVFGAPVEMENPERAGVECALEMLADADTVNEMLVARSLPTIRFGIGVNAGEVVAAHMGSEARRQYTAIGNTVNVAARLCSAAAAGQVVFSDDVQDVIQRTDAVDLGEYEFKGVARLTRVFRLGAEGVR